ncbi:MAG: tetratricopeptide repeat protein [Bacteroidales bacterium]|nr:tetratricopeptide repeat protein [Bacteroidales bacterium]
MANKKIDQDALRQENIESTVTKAERIYNDNKKSIWTAAGVAAVIILAVIGYSEFIAKPKAAEAMAQMFPAENSFAEGEFDLALNGDGNTLGFNDIIDQYGARGGKDIYFYAGVCNLRLEQYDEAIAMLKKYKGKDNVLAARAESCIGDAYTGLENYEEALKHFLKAAAKADNVYAATYYLRAGITCEELERKDEALKYYRIIKDKYSDSIEGYEIDKYITRAEAE